MGSKTITETFNQNFLNVGAKLAEKMKLSNVNYNTFLPDEFKNSLYFYPTDASAVISVATH